jgi:nucleotide-binding universal stress UspA family protein
MLIHVYSSVLPIVKPGSPTLTSVPVLAPEYSLKMIDITRDTGNKILAEGRRRVGNEGIKVQTILEEGHVVQEIVRVSKEGKFDLIIMGARGVSHIKEMLMGSVTDGVMHHVTCPVLIIR